MIKLDRSIVVLIVLTIAWFVQPLQTQSMAATSNRISIDQLKSLLDGKTDVIVVDTRSANSYRSGHIPGAISMTYSGEIRAKNQELPRDKTIIFY